jgi:primosomal protein N' (replication factor Y)
VTAGSVEARCASVAVPVPVRRLFTYTVPEALSDRIGRGARVRISFGNRRIEATVVEWPAPTPDPSVELKPILDVLEGAPRLSDALLELTHFVADYYLCSWGEAIEAALPPAAVLPRARPALRRTDAADPDRLAERATAQRRLLQQLPEDGTPLPLDRLDRSARRAARALIDAGWIERVASASPADVVAENAGEEATVEGSTPPFQPTAAQAAVLEELDPALEQRAFAPYLLFGATGSGKTEVYLRAAERTLALGRGVLYLVPEIGLTPLLVSKLEARFPGEVVVMHSALAARTRFDSWRRVRRGSRRFVIGTRSAVFAPMPDLGLVVVDEEQDTSYKQAETPRYNGRDLAVYRARAERAVVVLGSATPSLESFQHATAGRYRLLRLGGRIDGRPLARVSLVDMRAEYKRHRSVSPLSETLLAALRDCLDRGNQALVLRNRRGWSVALLCPRCGERVNCAGCSVAMTWHRSQRRLCCHYCGSREPYPRCCPNCGAPELKLLGEGTEQFEDLLRQALPDARIARMDRDTIRRRGAHEALLRRFEKREIDLIVGTQMIAKGHDFPDVTLVGVLSADQSLGLPDFRASERTFQLLTQVAGRAGRGGKPGAVLIQAFAVNHPVLRLAADQDYEAFFMREMHYRRALRYPPMSALVQIVVHDRAELKAQRWAAQLAEVLREEGRDRLLISGPGPAPVGRLKGVHRQQILARSAGRRRLVQTVDRVLGRVEGEIPRRAILVDVDPLSLM